MSTGLIIGGVLFLMLIVIGVVVFFVMGGDGDDSATTPTGPGPAPAPTGPEMLKCINTQRRGEMGWEFKGRVKTEAEARNLCPGKKYMSLECPTADGFEVFCVDDISLAETLLDKECKGDVAGTSLHGGTNVHCVGPYKWGDVHGGGANRGALYKI
jgi:hypothetical protein